MTVTECIDRYFTLIKEKPELFEKSEQYPIITDRAEMEKFALETGKNVGVLYSSGFNTLVVDLIKGENGLFTYERIIPTANGKGVVCVPRIGDKFVFLKQFRHPTRKYQTAFPRGFGENGISSMENAKKEIAEEIGGITSDVIFLGTVTADSGLIGSDCEIFLCELKSYDKSLKSEGIIEIFEMTLEEIKDMIARGEINDGFTLAAITLLENSDL